MTPQTLDLEDLAGAIGYTNCRVVATWFAGRRLSVPDQFSADHPVARLIGAVAFRRMVESFAGQRLAVPDAQEDERYRRMRAVAEMLASGATCDTIGVALGLSTRRVEQLRIEAENRGWISYSDRPRVRKPGRQTIGQPDVHVGPLEPECAAILDPLEL
jgi:hypothetical protein